MDKQLLLKKIKDPKFYIENFLKIQGKEPGLIPFILNEAQKDFMNAFRKHNRLIILKARQLGFCLDKNTKVLCSDLTWKTIDELQVGEKIIGFDEEGSIKEFVDSYVEAKKYFYTDDIYKLSFDNGIEIKATGPHRFFKITNENDLEWTKVEDFSVGEKILYFKTDEGDKTTGINKLHRTISKIEKLPPQEVVDIQTSTKTFIAEGLASHNSTLMTAALYHRTITTPGTNTALIGYDKDLTEELLEKVKTYLAGTPTYLRPTIRYNSKSEMFFEKLNSKILVLPSTTNVGRGYTLHNALLTELSSWADAEEKMITLEASVPINGKIVIESCVTGDTLILTDKGPRFIKDIHDWENHELGFSEGKTINLDGHYGLQPTSTYYNSGVQKGFRVITRSGNEIGMSSIHKLYVLREDKLEFVESKDMKPGDLLAIKYGQDLWGDNDTIDFTPTPYPSKNKQHIKLFSPKVITKDIAYLLGLLIGDGYIDIKRGRVTVTTTDKEVSDFLLSNNLGLKFYKGKSDNHYHYSCKNKSFVEFLEKYIQYKQVKSPKKEIPSIVLTWSKENVASFLSGLFDADGSCRKDRGSITLTSTSKDIVQVTQKLLLNFGIPCRIHKYTAKPTKKVKVFSQGFVLDICRNASSVFGKKIGFRIKRKQDNIAKVGVNYESFHEILPGIGKVFKKNKEELGLGITNKAFYTESGDMTYKTARRILGECTNKDSSIYKKIKELINKNYLYDEIKEIIPIEEQVYDFTVDNGHTFTSNAFVGHNTPRGQGNYYHKMWVGDNGYEKKMYGWEWLYSPEEIETIRVRMNNPRKFAQEYGLSFLASGRSVFDQYVLEEMRNNIREVGDVIEGENGIMHNVHNYQSWRVYKKPESDGLYVIGADVAEGVAGGDYSVAMVFDRRSGEEVAFFREHIAPDKFAQELDAIGRMYNNALMVVEINNHGISTVDNLKKLLYPSMYFRPAKFDAVSSAWSDRIGWKTDPKTRPLMIDELTQSIRDNHIIIHSKEFLTEATTFIFNENNRMEAQEGFHDDCVFAAGIALQGFKVLPQRPVTQLSEREVPVWGGY